MSILSVGTVLADNRALLVGIGNYDESATGFGRIHGNNDVELIRRKLKGFSVSCLIDARATKKNILHSLDTLCDNTGKGMSFTSISRDMVSWFRISTAMNMKVLTRHLSVMMPAGNATIGVQGIAERII